MKINKIMVLFIVVLLCSCTATKVNVQVPAEFAARSEMIHLPGLNATRHVHNVHMGKYKISGLKRSWLFKRTKDETKGSFLGRQQLIRLMGSYDKELIDKEDNRYYYSFDDGKIDGRVLCAEKFRQRREAIHTPVTGSFSLAQNYEYVLTGFILPISGMDTALWMMEIHKQNSPEEKSGPRLLSGLTSVEEGFVTNNNDTILLRPVNVSRANSEKYGTVDLPFHIVMAYEFRIGDGVVGIVDTIAKNIWLFNDLDDKTKFILAAASSAILLRKQDH